MAYSTKTSEGYVRHYPYGSLFADITGYYDAVQAADPYGVEAEYNSYLVQHQSKPKGLAGVLAQDKGTDSVVLTVSLSLQKVAEEALGGFFGAIVATDPQNGDILAMYSNPTYDPNGLSSLNPAANQRYYNSVANDRPNPSWGGSALEQRHELSDRTWLDLQGDHHLGHVRSRPVAAHDRRALHGRAPIKGTDLLLHNYGGRSRIPGDHPGRGAGQRPDRAGCRQQHDGSARSGPGPDPPAPAGAVRLGGARGRDQRSAAQRRDPLPHPGQRQRARDQ